MNKYLSLIIAASISSVVYAQGQGGLLDEGETQTDQGSGLSSPTEFKGNSPAVQVQVSIYNQMLEAENKRYKERLVQIKKFYLQQLERINDSLRKTVEDDKPTEVDAEIARVKAEIERLQGIAADIGDQRKVSNGTKVTWTQDKRWQVVSQQPIKDIKEQLVPLYKKHAGHDGIAEISYKPDLVHQVRVYPKSKDLFTNREYKFPDAFPTQPSRGVIVSPELRTLEATLSVKVTGAVMIHVFQGFRATESEVNEYIEKREKDGFVQIAKCGNGMDWQVLLVRIVVDEQLTFPPVGGWKQTPTLLISSLGDGDIDVKDVSARK